MGIIKFSTLLTTLLIGFVAEHNVLSQECLPYTERIDCHPANFESGDYQAECEALGCTFCPSEVPDWNVPSCYLPKSYGYKIEGEPQETSDGVRVNLRRATNLTMFGGDAETLTFEAFFQSDYRLRIKITDPTTSRFEVPLQVDAPSGGNLNRLYVLEFSDVPAFSFRVIRKSSGLILFDSSLGGLTFSDQFLQLSTKLPNRNLYGIGENEQATLRHHFDKFPNYALFSRDQFPEGNANLYGVQPHYTLLEDDGNAHKVVLVNSNAQEFVLLPSPGLLYRTIGGIFDIYMFLGPIPENTVQQYTEAMGRSALPPYWALGFQLCKYGYNSIEAMQAAVDRTAQYNIPHDVQYGDIDIMKNNMDFTIDNDTFHGLPEYVQELKGRGIKFMTILDPAIAATETPGSYLPFDLGTEMDVWVKKPDGTPALGKVWPPGAVAFPDFASNSTREWWITLIKKFHEELDWDALWIDMNEPANFVDGDVNDGCAFNKWNNPPYTPKIRSGYLPNKTLCMDHTDSISRHYDTHILYGWFESEPTLAGVLAARPGKRAFVLSRSNFIGTGRWVSHWLGDNHSQWSNLKTSIVGTLQFNQWGIPFVGPDICGHNGNATPELCQRWHELGAFYPFSRNHNAMYNQDQDPGFFGEEVAASTRKALEIRYTLLPHLYTLFFDHFTKGVTVARPLFHEFPLDPTAINVDTQFLWGEGLMISPVLAEGQTSLDIYFPDARWFSYYDGQEVTAAGVNNRMSWVTTPAPLDHINLHLRGGLIYPTQEAAVTTEKARKNPLGLIIVLDDHEEARGQLYYDDGELLDPVQSGQYFLAHYTFSEGQLNTNVEQNGWPDMNQLTVDSIRLMGSSKNYQAVRVGDQVIPVTTTASGEMSVVGLGLSPVVDSQIFFE